MIRNLYFAILFLAGILLGGTAYGQNTFENIQPVHMKERAFSFSLSTSGLGLGGTYRFPLPNYSHIGINLEFFVMRDDKEVEFYDPYFGYPVKLNNPNRLFLIPANVELKKRLFTNSIEDNFRPHLMLQVGGVYGMNFPREDAFILDQDNNRRSLDNEYQFTYNVVLGFGVDFTTRKNYFATIRPQYRLTFFSEEIANDKNHSAFEIKFEIGGQF